LIQGHRIQYYVHFFLTAGKLTSILTTISVTHCQCPRGETLIDNQCTACVVGKYKENMGNSEYVDCPLNFTTSPTSIDIDSLDHSSCKQGFGLLNNACSLCPVNSFWELYWKFFTLPQSSRCASCLVYSLSVDCSISIEQCA
jgi:hypothetical protein